MLSLIDQAIGFASRAHDGQWRKTGTVPYIAHPVGVAIILLEMGCDEVIVAAGLLHDTIEDTTVTLEDLRQHFGFEVADIVAGCTEPPKQSADWETRKLHTIRNLRVAPIAVKLVAAADKYHNLSHTLHNEQYIGLAVWENFGRGKEQQAWYYRSILESLTANVTNPKEYPIFARLAAIVEELFAGVTPQPPTKPPPKNG
jgi:(p)ppGpp synthase/HD superfamily hydrolase